MFAPKYEITPHLLKVLKEIAILRNQIDKQKLKTTTLVKLQKEALIRTAHSSTAIEGNTLNLAQVDNLLHDKPVIAEHIQQLEVLNYFEALKWIASHKCDKLSKNNLLKLHQLIVKNINTPDKTGAYRLVQNYIIDSNKKIIFTPPKASLVPKLIDDLLSWINTANDIDPIIISAITHHQFVTIHPFTDGNGRTARILCQWLLYKDFDHRHLYYLDEYFSKERQLYYQKINQARDLDYDLTFWIEYVAQGILETLQLIKQKVDMLTITQSGILLTPTQNKIIELLTEHGKLGSATLQEELKVNRARINQVISPLIKKGIIISEGKARATSYMLK